jgi:hypothetical protein
MRYYLRETYLLIFEVVQDNQPPVSGCKSLRRSIFYQLGWQFLLCLDKFFCPFRRREVHYENVA